MSQDFGSPVKILGLDFTKSQWGTLLWMWQRTCLHLQSPQENSWRSLLCRYDCIHAKPLLTLGSVLERCSLGLGCSLVCDHPFHSQAGYWGTSGRPSRSRPPYSSLLPWLFLSVAQVDEAIEGLHSCQSSIQWDFLSSAFSVLCFLRLMVTFIFFIFFSP